LELGKIKKEEKNKKKARKQRKRGALIGKRKKNLELFPTS